MREDWEVNFGLRRRKILTTFRREFAIKMRKRVSECILCGWVTAKSGLWTGRQHVGSGL